MRSLSNVSHEIRSAKGKDIPTVLHVTDFVLERLPFVFGGGKEINLMRHLLRLMLSVSIRHSHLTERVISLVLRVPQMLNYTLREKVIIALTQGACQLLKDVRKRVTEMSIAECDAKLAGPPVLQVFNGLSEGGQEVHLNEMLAPHTSVSHLIAGQNYITSAGNLVEMPVDSLELCMGYALGGSALLCRLLSQQPVNLGHLIRSDAVPDMIFLAAFGNTAEQACLMETLNSMLISGTGSLKGKPAELTVLVALLLESWSGHVLPLEPVEAASRWHSAITTLLKTVLMHLADMGVASMYGGMLLRPLIAAADEADQGSLFRESLCSCLQMLLKTCPEHLPSAVPALLLLLQSMTAEVKTSQDEDSDAEMCLAGLFSQVACWLQQPVVKNCLVQELKLRVYNIKPPVDPPATAQQHQPHGERSHLEVTSSTHTVGGPAQTLMSSKGSQDEAEDDVVIVDAGAVIAGGITHGADAETNKKKRLRQSQMTFGESGALASQADLKGRPPKRPFGVGSVIASAGRALKEQDGPIIATSCSGQIAVDKTDGPPEFKRVYSNEVTNTSYAFLPAASPAERVAVVSIMDTLQRHCAPRRLSESQNDLQAEVSKLLALRLLVSSLPCDVPSELLYLLTDVLLMWMDMGVQLLCYTENTVSSTDQAPDSTLHSIACKELSALLACSFSLLLRCSGDLLHASKGGGNIGNSNGQPPPTDDGTSSFGMMGGLCNAFRPLSRKLWALCSGPTSVEQKARILLLSAALGHQLLHCRVFPGVPQDPLHDLISDAKGSQSSALRAASLLASCLVPLVSALELDGFLVSHGAGFSAACRATLTNLNGASSTQDARAPQIQHASAQAFSIMLLLSTAMNVDDVVCAVHSACQLLGDDMGGIRIGDHSSVLNPLTAKLVSVEPGVNGSTEDNKRQQRLREQQQEQRSLQGPSLSSLGPVLQWLLFQPSSEATGLQSQLVMMEALTRYMFRVSGVSLMESRELLRQLLHLLGSASAPVRKAAVPMSHTLLRPDVLLQGFGPTKAKQTSGASATSQLEDIHEAEKQFILFLRARVDLNESEGELTSILTALQQLYRNLKGGESRVSATIIMVCCLGNESGRVRAKAATALFSCSRQMDITPKKLLLHGTVSGAVLEYIGRHILDQPSLLYELTKLLAMPELEIIKEVVPRVIGWLCVHQKKEELQALADLMETSVPTLYVNHADHATAYAFWVGSQAIEPFMTFVDDIMAPKEHDFLTVCKCAAREIARQVVWMSGLPTEWGPPPNMDPPDNVVSRTRDYLDLLGSKILGNKPEEAITRLLNGHAVAVLLKDFGNLFSQPATLSSPAVNTGQICRDNTPSASAGVNYAGDENETDKMQTLRALSVLLILLGPHIANHMPHIMAVLAAALRDVSSTTLKMQALCTWHVFVKSLATCGAASLGEDESLLGRVAQQSVVVLMEALEEGGEVQSIAVDILEEIIIKHRALIRNSLPRMPPLPSMPSLSKVNKILAEEQQRANNPRRHLQVLLESLRSESLSVRNAAVGELRLILTKRDGLMENLLEVALGNAKAAVGEIAVSRHSARGNGGSSQCVQRPAPVEAALLAEMMASLLRCCDNVMRTHLGRSLKLRCAECLGILGAIDPARVNVAMPLPEPLCEFRFEGTLSFQTQLLQRHLVRILETTDNITTVDFATYSIQALLQGYAKADALFNGAPGSDAGGTTWFTGLPIELQKKLSEIGASTSSMSNLKALELLRKREVEDQMQGVPNSGGGGGLLYDNLMNRVQLIVRPYLDSKFTLEDVGNRAGMAAQEAASYTIIFGRQKHSFRRWLELWLKTLSRWVCGPQQAAFAAVSPVLKWDLPLMTFLLPQAVHNIVSYGSDEARAAIRDELIAVLRSCVVVSEGTSEQELYLQVLFTLLDVLGRWVKDVNDVFSTFNLNQQGLVARQQPSSGRSSGGSEASTGDVAPPSFVKRVEDFLSSIPPRLLAQAAFRCGGHARALQYFESYVRSTNGGAMNPAAHSSVTYHHHQVSFLLEVYGQLEEPDGLSGLVQLRQGGLTTADQILVAEKAGAWGEALALYEHELGREGMSSVMKQDEPDVRSNTSTISMGPQRSAEGLSSLQQGRLRCLLQVGYLQSLLQQVEGLLVRKQQQQQGCMQLLALGVSAAWRLGHWSVLKEFLGFTGHTSSPDSASNQRGVKVRAVMPPLLSLNPQEQWDVCLGQLLLGLHEERFEDVKTGILEARQDIMAVLPAISQESYVRAYPQVAKLHMLQEIQDTLAILLADDAGWQSGGRSRSNNMDSVIMDARLKWQKRLSSTQASLGIQEPLLSMRRQLAGILGLEKEAGAAWLQYAKLCRSAGQPEAAATSTLEAIAREVPGARLERAKLLWQMGKQHRAIEELQSALKGMPSQQVHQSMQKKTWIAKMAVKLASWTAAEGQMGYADLKVLFERAIQIDDKWEKGYFEYGRYLDQLYQDAKRRQTQAKDGKGLYSRVSISRARVAGVGEERSYWEYLPDVLLNYGRSIEAGRRHALHSLPRVITLYCDFGLEAMGGNTGGVNSGRGSGGGGTKVMQSKERNAATQVVNLMKDLARTLSPSSWLLALPQLTSRICHPAPDVHSVVQTILVRIAEAYPQQALWSLAAVCKSSVQARRNAASNIVSAAHKSTSSDDGLRRVFSQFSQFSDHLIKLCHWAPASQKQQVKSISASQEFDQLLRMLPSKIMVPVQDALSNPLPPMPSGQGASSLNSNVVTIAGMEDTITVMASLQRPKKITFTGSDGQKYSFLAKPKDDLRKDYRLMDFAGMLNSLFNRGDAPRRRNLKIRTYAVLPLTEDCGILQWINHLYPYKAACEDTYTAEGVYKRREMHAYLKKVYQDSPGPYKMKNFEKVLQATPPRLHKWFLAKFPEPATWLQARLNFTRTNAVWCMTGHMLGLGDRHGENLLIDTASGDTVHVDFGCLFNRGLTLEIPELVPFRLTQNVIDCFGVSGVEGAFRKCAEITLQVLREHKEVFMTCAETFLYDPLVDWTKQSGSRSSSTAMSEQTEIENPAAKEALVTIEGRLSGTLLGVLCQPSIPLSCEGQAQRLISEATDKDNLAAMYVWWLAWM
ncbi:hypothetical protein CEUSTIGMA_g2366.t1 [Chlamydomonas eustigma]|uniref:Serine/threonine-protein kinase ATR n=1 Tax=Chlamydomonas eustigma TaxID=1157962 RepID=A0A250WWL2_9CHLO|nr:hypothetical protein CEUSTIGMA_g2366.t1 [Chlamydomonas eustigma]|eukprot:GAX74920.1 hypothetical protein CEUSTIGMA_g2366.t1 [Chlamydomonas eustigma]